MQLQHHQLCFSATDIANFIECEHLTVLDLISLRDDQQRARKVRADESAELIARKGIEHEAAYLAHLIAQGLSVVDIAEPGGSLDDKVERTRAAMRDGPDVIYQAALRDGHLFGHADFLLRVDGQPSSLGIWRYEVADTKLARSPKAKFVVQLAVYSQLVTRAHRVPSPCTCMWCWATRPSAVFAALTLGITSGPSWAGFRRRWRWWRWAGEQLSLALQSLPVMEPICGVAASMVLDMEVGLSVSTTSNPRQPKKKALDKQGLRSFWRRGRESRPFSKKCIQDPCKATTYTGVVGFRSRRNRTSDEVVQTDVVSV